MVTRVKKTAGGGGRAYAFIPAFVPALDPTISRIRNLMLFIVSNDIRTAVVRLLVFDVRLLLGINVVAAAVRCMEVRDTRETGSKKKNSQRETSFEFARANLRT